MAKHVDMPDFPCQNVLTSMPVNDSSFISLHILQFLTVKEAS